MTIDTPAQDTDTQGGGKIRAWLQLIRMPALFTAFADIAAGFVSQNNTGFEPVGQFASLLTASGCLYIAGMILNDVFDRHRDAESRSNRPIPSGRIPASSAVLASIGLIIVGIASAWSVSWQALFISLGLTGCILAYDGLLKATILGPLAMGACRFLNVMLGTATQDLWDKVWEMPQVGVAAAIGVYVVGVTWFARTEEKTSGRLSLLGGALIANLGMAMLAGIYYGRPIEQAWRWGGNLNGTLLAGLVMVIAVTVDRRLLLAIRSPSPAFVQAAVKLMLLSIITLDATVVLAATGAIVPAMAVALLAIPALLIGRWLYIT